MASGFSNIIMNLRKEQGLSQKQAAKDLGISQALLSHYEKGIRECGLDFVVKAAKYYGVTCDYLLGLSDINTDIVHYDTEDEYGNDIQISENTIFKAAGILLQKVAASHNEKLMKDIFWMYDMSIYKTILIAGSYGIIPKNSSDLSSKNAYLLSDTAVKACESDAISGCKGSKKTNEARAPLTIQNVVKASEKYVSNKIEELTSSK